MRNDLKKLYNKFYSEHGPGVHTDPARFVKIASLCRGSVLDVGCGTGDLADFVSGDYMGIDVSNVALNKAKLLRRPTALWVEGDPVKNRVKLPKKFDTVVMAEFLEHLSDEGLLWDNFKDWVAVGARLIVSVPSGDRVPDENHLRQFNFSQLRSFFSAFGKVRFYNWSGAKNRIILSCDLDEKNVNSLSLVMIAKNEEKGVENAILSAIDVVDRVVIDVDSTSSDKTDKIVKLYADDSRPFVWKGDFAAARNLVQSHVKTEWSLILDGHEYIDTLPDLSKALSSDYDAFFVQVKLENGFVFWFPRLIRTSVRWAKPVHNYPEFKNPSKLKGFIIKHDRLNFQSESSRAVRDVQRGDMVVRILGNSLKKNKRDTRSAFYLAQYYFYAGNFSMAVKYYKKYLKYANNKEERWLVLYELGNSYNFQNRPKKAIKAYLQANREFPGRWEIDKRIGATFMILKKFSRALDYLVESFSVGPMVYMFNPEIRNNAQTWYLISQCFLSLKNFRKFKIAAKQALRDNERSGFKNLGNNEVKILKNVLSAR